MVYFKLIILWLNSWLQWYFTSFSQFYWFLKLILISIAIINRLILRCFVGFYAFYYLLGIWRWTPWRWCSRGFLQGTCRKLELISCGLGGYPRGRTFAWSPQLRGSGRDSRFLAWWLRIFGGLGLKEHRSFSKLRAKSFSALQLEILLIRQWKHDQHHHPNYKSIDFW